MCVCVMGCLGSRGSGMSIGSDCLYREVGAPFVQIHEIHRYPLSRTRHRTEQFISMIFLCQHLFCPILCLTIFLSFYFLDFCSLLLPPGLFSPSESDPTDPALFLSVLFWVDLTVEEMFCLILKCEEICGRSAKSHYSPPCSALLHEANPEEEEKTRRDTQRENVHTPQTDVWLRFQTQSSWSKLIVCNWLVKYFLMPSPCRIQS